MMQFLKNNVSRIIMFIIQKILGIDNNKVLFESFGGKQYSDSPRSICEELHNHNPNLKLVWLLNDDAYSDKYKIIPDYVIKVKNSKWRKKIEVATCKVFITNITLFPTMYKSKKQLFIQTWHGERGFKKILFDAYNDNKRKVPYTADYKLADICTSGSTFGEKLYRSAFNYKGKILKSGVPRNDKLIIQDIENEKRVREILKIKENDKILLYAPTFRDYLSEKQNVEIDFNRIIELLNKKYNNNWICLVRAHTVSSGLIFNSQNIIDATSYPDMADILSIADFLITDYSSSPGDFILTKKPIILYQPDVEDYINNCRGLYFDINDSGYLVAHSQIELENMINKLSIKDYKESCEKVLEFYGVYETGESSKKVCDEIIRHIRG